jgi:hypothetical protein
MVWIMNAWVHDKGKDRTETAIAAQSCRENRIQYLQDQCFSDMGLMIIE